MQSAKDAAASIKETAASIADSAKSAVEEAKATVEETMEKMSTSDTFYKEMAIENKQENEDEAKAELKNQEAPEHNATANKAAHTTSADNSVRVDPNTTTAAPGHPAEGHKKMSATPGHGIPTNNNLVNTGVNASQSTGGITRADNNPRDYVGGAPGYIAGAAPGYGTGGCFR